MTRSVPQPVKPVINYQEITRITDGLQKLIIGQETLLRELAELIKAYSMYLTSTLAELNTDTEVEPSYKDVKDGEVENPHLDPRA